MSRIKIFHAFLALYPSIKADINIKKADILAGTKFTISSKNMAIT